MDNVDWSVEVPIENAQVLTEPDAVTGEIRQVVTAAGKVEERIIQTKANHVRNALIDLGWTPPEGDEIQLPILEPVHIAEAREKAKVISLRGTPLLDCTRDDLLVMAVEYCIEHFGENDERKHDPEKNNA